MAEAKQYAYRAEKKGEEVEVTVGLTDGKFFLSGIASAAQEESAAEVAHTIALQKLQKEQDRIPHHAP